MLKQLSRNETSSYKPSEIWTKWRPCNIFWNIVHKKYTNVIMQWQIHHIVHILLLILLHLLNFLQFNPIF